MSRTSGVRGILDISYEFDKRTPRAVKDMAARSASRPLNSAKPATGQRNMQFTIGMIQSWYCRSGYMKLRVLFKPILFIGIVAALSYLYGWLFMYKGAERLDVSYRSLPPDTLDIVFLGPSEAMNGVYPLEMWNHKGYTCFNAACGNQSLAESYYVLRDVLRHQHPKLVMLECMGARKTQKIISEATLHYVTDRFCNIDPLKWEMVKDLAPDDSELQYFLPIYAYHNQWSDIKNYNFIPLERDVTFGAKVHNSTKVGHPYEGVPKDNIAEIPEVSAFYLHSIIRLCRDEDINICLYTAPTILPVEGKPQNADIYRSLNGVGVFAEEEGVPFLNLNYIAEEMQIDPACDYADDIHFNYRGAQKLTYWLSNYISEHYSLIDHRNDANYLRYQRAYESYERYAQTVYLRSINSWDHYLDELIAVNRDYLVIVSVKDIVGYYLSEDMIAKLKEIGIKSDFEQHGWLSYIAVLYRGKLLYENLNDIESQTDIYENLVGGCSLRVVSSPLHADNLSEIVINGFNYSLNKRGFNIVVFDPKKNQLIDKAAIDTHNETLPISH